MPPHVDGGFEASQEHPVGVEVVHHLVHQGHVQRPLTGGEQTTVEAAGRVSQGVQDDVKPGGRKNWVMGDADTNVFLFYFFLITVINTKYNWTLLNQPLTYPWIFCSSSSTLDVL